MHGLGDLAAAAEREAVDGGDDRLAERFEPRGHGLSAPDEIADGGIAAVTDAASEFVDVGAGGERAVARAGQDHGTYGGISLDRVQHGHQAVDQCVVQRVELFGPVERDQRNAVIDFEQDGIGHQGSVVPVAEVTLGSASHCVYSLVGIHPRHGTIRHPDTRAHHLGGERAVLQ